MTPDQLAEMGARLRDSIKRDTIHYASKRSPSYPNASCGKVGISIIKTDDKEKVTCSRCLKTINSTYKRNIRRGYE